jgi:sec-independent protein translocase protein TatC
MLKRDEDYFKDTTMTFGEHLEELRACLIKAVFGLVVGLGIGLFFGRQIVEVIEHPLQAALSRYYEDVAVKKYKEFLEVQKNVGAPLPYTEKRVEYLVKTRHLIYELQYVDFDQVRGALVADHTTLADKLPPPAAQKAVQHEAPPEGKQDARPDEKQDAPPNGKEADPQAASQEIDEPEPKFVPVFLWHPIADDSRISPKVLNATEGFMIWFKAAFVLGIVLASPWIFLQVWAFVAAGLYPHEKKYVHLFLPFSLGLFFLGAATAYLFVFEPVLKFLFDYSGWLGFEIDPRISEWMSFVIFLPLGFGISFQLPLVMLFLERIGVFNTQVYLERWRIAILVIVVLSAVLTPADPYSLFFMAVPLTVLYFGGILLCRLLPRGRFAVEPVA